MLVTYAQTNALRSVVTAFGSGPNHRPCARSQLHEALGIHFLGTSAVRYDHQSSCDSCIADIGERDRQR